MHVQCPYDASKTVFPRRSLPGVGGQRLVVHGVYQL